MSAQEDMYRALKDKLPGDGVVKDDAPRKGKRSSKKRGRRRKGSRY